MQLNSRIHHSENGDGECKMKNGKGFLFRWFWSSLVFAFTLLLLLPGSIIQVVEANSSWVSGGIPNDPVITNTDISIAGDTGFLQNLKYPLNTANNFMQKTGGGEAYSVRYRQNGIMQQFGFSQGGYIPGAWTLTGPLQMNALDIESNLRVVTSVILPAQGKYLTINYLLQNTSNTLITDLKFYEYVEPNANSQDQETTTYDAARNLIYSTNNLGSQKYMGVYSNDMTDKHDIGNPGILSRIMSDSLNNAVGPYTGDSWFAFEKDLGNLGPGEQRQISAFFLVGDSLADIQSLTDQLSPKKVPAFSNAGTFFMVGSLAPLIGLFVLWRSRRQQDYR
jgi:hypothetical protein